jgi:lysozyme family protein
LKILINNKKKGGFMYTEAFEKAVDHAMLYEVGGFWNVDAPGARDGTNRKASGYVNDPVDAGGETKYGIAKTANPTVNIKTLDWEGAKAIYYEKYWLAAKCNKMGNRVAILHFDGAVNHGVGRAAKFLQRAIGVADDGAIGPTTLSTLAAMDPIAVCHSICDQRAKFYHDIVAAKPAQVKFLKGWMRRIDEMRAFTTDPSRNF